jgi:hypothetical protein
VTPWSGVSFSKEEGLVGQYPSCVFLSHNRKVHSTVGKASTFHQWFATRLVPERTLSQCGCFLPCCQHQETLSASTTVLCECMASPAARSRPPHARSATPIFPEPGCRAKRLWNAVLGTRQQPHWKVLFVFHPITHTPSFIAILRNVSAARASTIKFGGPALIPPPSSRISQWSFEGPERRLRGYGRKNRAGGAVLTNPTWES